MSCNCFCCFTCWSRSWFM